jgi:hypothetical protein
VVKFLVESGANIKARDNKVLRAASYGNLQRIKFLVKNGDNRVLRCNSGNEHLDIIKFLVELGAK